MAFTLFSGLYKPSNSTFIYTNMTLDDVDDVIKNLMSLNSSHLIDVTPDLNTVVKYRASLGHKVYEAFHLIAHMHGPKPCQVIGFSFLFGCNFQPMAKSQHLTEVQVNPLEVQKCQYLFLEIFVILLNHLKFHWLFKSEL